MNLDATFFNAHDVITVSAREIHGGQFLSVSQWRVGILHSIGEVYNHLHRDPKELSHAELFSDHFLEEFMYEPLDEYVDWRVVEVKKFMPQSRGIHDPSALSSARSIIKNFRLHLAQNPRPALAPIPA